MPPGPWSRGRSAEHARSCRSGDGDGPPVLEHVAGVPAVVHDGSVVQPHEDDVAARPHVRRPGIPGHVDARRGCAEIGPIAVVGLREDRAVAAAAAIRDDAEAAEVLVRPIDVSTRTGTGTLGNSVSAVCSAIRRSRSSVRCWSAPLWAAPKNGSVRQYRSGTSPLPKSVGSKM